MGNEIGRTVDSATIGRPLMASADGRPEWKPAGISVDWATVAAVAGADVTLVSGAVIKIGKKYLRYGQVLTKITASGKYGPYDPAALDGRQTLVRGDAFILNETVLEDDLNSNHPPVFNGGIVFKARILATTGAASLAAGPTFANLETVFPRLTYAND